MPRALQTAARKDLEPAERSQEADREGVAVRAPSTGIWDVHLDFRTDRWGAPYLKLHH